MGDLAFPCFTLAGKLKKSPAAIATDLAASLAESVRGNKQVERGVAAGPYLNIFFTPAFRAGIVSAILEGDWLAPEPARAGRVMIEYSQPNTHKVFHVGHMRNVALGDVLVRLYEFAGREVVAANYIGDVGTHIAKCLWVFTRHFKGEAPAQHRGEFLGGLYKQADELLDFTRLTAYPHPGLFSARVLEMRPHPGNADWKVLKLDAGAKGQAQVVCGGTGFQTGAIVAWAPPDCSFLGRLVQRVDKAGISSEGLVPSCKELGTGEDRDKIHIFPRETPLGAEITEIGRRPGCIPTEQSVAAVIRERGAEVRAVLRGLEAREPSLERLWRETRQWSLDEFSEIYAWIGCRFDHYFYESEVDEEGKRLALEALEKGQLMRSEGAIGADLSTAGLGFCMLLKSDGTTLYATKDLALARRKFEKFNVAESLYIVDHSQSLHFQQVFKTLELLGFAQAARCRHVAYGLVNLPEGKMSSRKGNIIPFSKLRAELGAHIRREFLHKYQGEWPEAEIAEAERRIAVAAIRYGMLNQEPIKNIVFDMREWTSPVGNTGPYLLYAYARTRSILREVPELAGTAFDGALLIHEKERVVLNELAGFRRAVLRAVRDHNPQVLCAQLYELARAFSRMYEECPVKRAGEPALQAARLKLVAATGAVLRRGLGLLGIEVLERM